jgi:glutathione S-transferase
MDIAYTPYMTSLDHLQSQFMWDKRPHLADWYERLKGRASYGKAVVEWLNASYLSLMEEKRKETQPKIKSILGMS